MRNKVRELQRSLYRAAKANPERYFHSLYDKVYRSDVLWEAWKRVKANGGVPGNDGDSIEDIMEYGEVSYLRELQQELREGKYRTGSIRRVYIVKPDGKKSPWVSPACGVWDRIRWYADKMRYQNLPIEWIVEKLNPVLLGWTNYLPIPTAIASSGSHRPIPIIVFGKHYAAGAKRGWADIGTYLMSNYTGSMVWPV